MRTALVRLKGQNAGILREEPEGGTSFVYNTDFKQDIACILPRYGVSYSHPYGLLPFFQQMTPEGWLRNRQARSAEIDLQDDLGVLLAFGYDCIGAVSIHSPDDRKPNIDIDKLDAMTRAAVKARKTISGVQPKLYATQKDGKFIAADDTTPADWIAKFSTDDVEHMVLNEDISLRLTATLLGESEVTIFQYGAVENIEGAALLVKRFDRTPTGEKLRLEDFTQILNIPREPDYNGKYRGSFEQIAAAIHKFSAAPAVDLLKFFQRVVAFSLLGNCDCHLKNWSLLETLDGTLRLSPTYDVVNTYVYAKKGYSTDFGLEMGGQKRGWNEITPTILKQFGLSIGLNEKSIQYVFTTFAGKRDALLSIIEPKGSEHLASADFRQLYADLLLSSYERILT